MRKAITTLQSAHRLFGEELDLESISIISGVIPEVQKRSQLVFLVFISSHVFRPFFS
jgi:hypothetical protein